MRIIRKQVYYCDHCGKRSLASGAMKKHEQRCTKNPKRVCGVCKMLEHEQPNLEELKNLVRQSGVRPGGFDEEGVWNAIIPEGFVAKLRDAAGTCPACMMAALRQTNIPIPFLKDQFDFTTEMKAIWTHINDCRCEYDQNDL